MLKSPRRVNRCVPGSTHIMNVPLCDRKKMWSKCWCILTPRSSMAVLIIATFSILLEFTLMLLSWVILDFFVWWNSVFLFLCFQRTLTIWLIVCSSELLIGSFCLDPPSRTIWRSCGPCLTSSFLGNLAHCQTSCNIFQFPLCKGVMLMQPKFR